MSQPTSPTTQTQPSSPNRRHIATSDFSPETERASTEFLRCLEKKDYNGKSKLLNCVVESSSAAEKPTVAQSLLTVTKHLLSKIQPAAIPPPTDPSCSDPIDKNAFQLHRPNWKGGIIGA